MYESRTYRNWVEDKDLLNFHLKVEESDLFIRADKEVNSQAEGCLRHQRRALQSYIQEDPQFARSLKPYSVKNSAPEIVREMSEAGFYASVGPMAAVAGAIAEYVGKHLLKISSEVIVENGGDIFMQTKKARRIGIFAGKSVYTGKLALEIGPKDARGICTSSGTVGPSLSFGRADACVVVSHSAILADAWATRLGNMVKAADDIERTLEFVKDKAGIKGVMLILGEKIGVWGKIKLIKLQNENLKF